MNTDDNKMTVRRMLQLLSQAHSLDDEITLFVSNCGSLTGNTDKLLNVSISLDYYIYDLNGLDIAYRDGKLQLIGHITEVHEK